MDAGKASNSQHVRPLSASTSSTISSISSDPNHFPSKLHATLAALEESDDAREIVSWQPHGKAFKIHASEQEFTDKVLSM